MKSKLLNLGKALDKKQQQKIMGGAHRPCDDHQDCPGGQGCCYCVGLCFLDSYPGLQPGGFCWDSH